MIYSFLGSPPALCFKVNPDVLYYMLRGEQNWDNLRLLFKALLFVFRGESRIPALPPPEFFARTDDPDDPNEPSSSKESGGEGSPAPSTDL